MAYNFKTVVSCLLFLTSFYCNAQDDEKKETVFITQSDPGDKAVPEFYFGQLSLSTPLRGNPYRDEIRADYAARGEEYKPTVLDYVLPNGLSAHIGFGVHYKSWIGFSTNTGIDWIATEKIVAAPVYGSIFFTPQIWEETNLYLQGGYGYSFALGRGDLSGAYQKYRLGLIFDNTGSIFLDVSMSNFPLHELEKVGAISLGVAITNFGL
ncbi:hypothetical protein HYN59_02645 [Flavobacterium album]|uniref:Outer membrane protein beta-barrel domain-containing protein n=1 Tax=Flavobacterium album TaxID=2175091 RepID=A0A2S1QUM7_9FLAO|nr:hypothetical protein [Flavobacterium album]AWH84076.1 hypothetical protein HYN59_02645 [Flavobacterium album]